MRFFKTVVLWLVYVTGIQAQIAVVPTVHHLASASTPSAGAINLAVSGGLAPYTYLWSPGGYTTQNIGSKPYGAYSVKVRDANGDTAVSSVSIGYKVQWDRLNGCELKHDTLVYRSGNWSSAVSKNTLAAGQDGWVEYVLKGTETLRMVGFIDSLSPSLNEVHDFDHAFYYDGYLYTVTKGIFLSANIVAVNPPGGTILRIERKGDSVLYKMNGSIVNYAIEPIVTQQNWKIRASLASGEMSNIGCSFYNKGNTYFSNYIRLVPDIIHATNSLTNDGNIKITPVQGGIHTYTWQPGSSTGSMINAKDAGLYTITVKDSLSHISENRYTIGYKAKWDRLNGCELSHDTLKYKSGNWPNSVSKNTLIAGQDGWIEYVLKDRGSARIIGFIDSLSPSLQDIRDFDYSFYIDNYLYIYSKGAISNIIYSTPPEGTILRIERRGDSILYLMNGIIVNYVIEPVATQKNWKIKASLTSGELSNIGCSFYNEGNTYFPNYTHLIPDIVHASNSLSNDGSIKMTPAQNGVYTYTWQPGSYTGAQISSKASGTYSVTVEDNGHHTNTNTYNVGYKVMWDQPNRSTIIGDSLKAIYISQDSWGTAISKNMLMSGEPGWLEYVLKDIEQYKIVGFTDSLSPVIKNMDDINFGFYYAWGIIYAVENNNLVFLMDNPVEGTVLRIERNGDTISYKINRIIVFKSISANSGLKKLKVEGLVYNPHASSLINVGCSFSYSSALSLSPVIANYTNEDDRGAIDLGISGGSPNYNIAWNGLKVKGNHQYLRDLDSAFGGSVDSLSLYTRLDNLRGTQTLTNIPSAIYNNTIKDQAGDSIHATTLVGNKFGWITNGVSTNTCVIVPDTASSFVVYYGQGQKLTKTASGTGLNYAVSDRILSAADRELYIEAGIVNTTDEMAIGLKTASSQEVDSISDMIGNTMIHFKGSGTKSMDIYYAGNIVRTQDYLAGDAIGILLNPKNSTIVYYRNFSPIYTQTNVPDEFFATAYQFKALLKTPAAQLTNIILVGQVQPMRKITATVADVTCGSLSTGSISFNAQSMLGGEAVCSYTATGPGGYSTTGSVTGSNVLTGLYAGVYTITVQVRSGSCAGSLITSMGQSFTVAYMPDWINQSPFGSTNVSTTDRSFNITAIQSSPYAWLGGASTTNVLEAGEEGWAEFSPLFSGSYTTTRALAFGFNNEDLGTHPSDNDHGFYISSSIPVVVIGLGGGSSQSVGPYTASLFTLGNPGTLFNFSPTDRLKIKKIALNGGLNMKMEFYKNNVLIPSPNTVYPATDLVADISVNQKDVYINKPRITFGCSTNIPYYFVLKKILDAGYYTSYRKKIYFAFEEEYFDPAQGSANSLSYKIVTDANLPVSTSPGLIETIGDNRFSIDLSLVTGMTQGRFYRIAITNKKNEVFYARFKY